MSNSNTFAIVSSQEYAKTPWEALCADADDKFKVPSREILQQAEILIHEAFTTLSASPHVNDPEEVRKIMYSMNWLDHRYWDRSYYDTPSTEDLARDEQDLMRARTHQDSSLAFTLKLYQAVPKDSYLEYKLGNFIKGTMVSRGAAAGRIYGTDMALLDALAAAGPALKPKSKAANFASELLLKTAVRLDKFDNPDYANIILSAASKKTMAYATAAYVQAERNPEAMRKNFAVVANGERKSIDNSKWRQTLDEIKSIGYASKWGEHYYADHDFYRLGSAIHSISVAGRANDPALAGEVREKFIVICKNEGAMDQAYDRYHSNMSQRSVTAARKAKRMWEIAPAGTYLKEEMKQLWMETAKAMKSDCYGTQVTFPVDQQRAAWRDIRARSTEAALNAEFIEGLSLMGRRDEWASIHRRAPRSHPLFKAAEYVMQPEAVKAQLDKPALRLVAPGNDLT